MARRKGKSISFDAMIKFFIQYYNIPTRKDIEKLMTRIDRLEALIKAHSPAAGGLRGSDATPAGKAAETSADLTLEVIKRARKGVGFAEIQARTGFDEKKLRNIIFRLSKAGKIVRISRGVYTAA